MKNNKKIIDVFFGSLLLQVVFLLAYSINFIFAQVSTSPLVFYTKINNAEISNSAEINEIKNISATITSTDTTLINTATKVNFIFDNPNTLDVIDYSFPATINPDNSSNWMNNKLNTLLENGVYNFYIEAVISANTTTDYANKYSSDYIRIKINNIPTKTITVTTSLSVELIDIPISPLSGNQVFYAKTNKKAEYVKFKIFPGVNNAYELYTGHKVSEFTNEYYFELPTASFPNGIYKIMVIANDGINIDDDYINNIEINNDVNNTINSTDPNLNIMPIIKFSEEYKTAEISLSDNQRISVTSNKKIDINLLKFKTRKVENLENEGYREYTTLQDINNLYYFNLDTNSLANNTRYYVKAFYNGIIIDYFIAKINNIQAVTADTPEVIEDVTIQNNVQTITNNISEVIEDESNQGNMQVVRDENSEAIRDSTIPDNTQTEADNNSEIKNTILDTTFTPYPTPKTLLCDTVNIKDQKKCYTYLFELKLPEECRNQNFEKNEDCTEFIFSKSFPLICKEKNITTKEECNKEIEKQNSKAEQNSFIYKDCTKIGITDIEECHYDLRKKYKNFKNVIRLNRENNQQPIECKERNISDINECEKFMFREYAPEECKTQNIDSTEECDNLVFEKITPYDCKKDRITSFESCNELMFEKYNNEYKMSQDQFPVECQSENIKSDIECKKIIRTIYLPKKCTINGIQNIKECEILLSKKNIIKECQSENITSKNECNDYLFNQFGSQKCEQDGINKQEECENHIFNEYISKINCEDKEDWKCKNIIIEKYLGDIAYKQTIYEEIEKNKEKLNNNSMQIKNLKEIALIPDNIIPIKDTETSIKAIQSSSSLTLDKEGNLLQLSPIILALDTDQDGMPDDIEKRIGTNPNSKDTDSDGYSDVEEIRKGYNPNGEGAFEKDLFPIETAIINNEQLEHPKNKGQQVDSLEVKSIINLKKKNGYILEGKATPNSIATIYIYSDLPVIITTTTDEDGNWKYEMKNSLTDGEHEVYIVINDNTGKIREKSKPFSLFIKQTEAVSVKDFLLPTDESIPKKSDLSIYYYKIISLLLVITGIFMFLVIIIKKNKTNNKQNNVAI